MRDNDEILAPLDDAELQRQRYANFYAQLPYRVDCGIKERTLTLQTVVGILAIVAVILAVAGWVGM